MSDFEFRRPVAGRLKFNSPVETGTLLGPMWTNELLVALGTDAEGYTVFGYAQQPEIDAVISRLEVGEDPRSQAEANMRSTKTGILIKKQES